MKKIFNNVKKITDLSNVKKNITNDFELKETKYSQDIFNYLIELNRKVESMNESVHVIFENLNEKIDRMEKEITKINEKLEKKNRIKETFHFKLENILTAEKIQVIY